MGGHLDNTIYLNFKSESDIDHELYTFWMRIEGRMLNCRFDWEV